MKKIFYSERPSVFQFYENGEVQYRWDIEEEEVVQMEGSKIQYSCYEVTIYKPLSKEELTKAVIFGSIKSF